MNATILDQCADPAAWDALRANLPWRELISLIPGTSHIANIRRAQLLLSASTVEIALAAEALSDPALPAPARGVRMLLMGQILQYEQVLAMNYERRGTGILDQEESVYAHMALSLVNSTLGHHRDAHTDARIALEHARALGMADRVHYLSILAGRHNRGAGRADPAASGARLRYPVQQASRFGFALRSHAEDFMALGDYSRALTALGPPEADEQMTSGLRAFLHTILGIPHLHPYSGHDQRYGAVTSGLLRYLEGSNEIGNLLDVGHEPQATYGRLVAAAMMARSGTRSLSEILRVLGECPQAADQRALWQLIRWQAGSYSDDALLRHVLDTSNALRACRNVRDLMSFIKRVSPEMFMLLRATNISWPGEVPSADDVPVLYGRRIVYRSAEYPSPGRIGRVLVNRALHVEDDELERAESARLSAKLKEFGVPEDRLVNWGQVVQTLSTVAAAAAGTTEPSEPWEEAARAAMNLLTPCVQKTLPFLLFRPPPAV